MEEEKDPFEGTATPVGLTFPSVGLRPWIVNSTPQTVDSTPSTANSSHSSVNLTPPRSDSAYGDQEEKDPFEGTATPIGLTPPNSKNVLKIVDVYGNAFSNKFASTSDTSRVEDMSGSSKNMTEEDDMYIIEDPSPNKEKRNILYDLISEAIMETNSGIFTKGFCTLEEIYDYISKLRLIGLSSNWKQEVFEILYEKRTEFIHIPCGTKPFQDGSWTLHPLVAKSHKAVKRSPLKSLRNFSNIPMVKLSSHFEDGEPVPWGGWGEDQMEQLVKKYNTLDYLIDSVSNNEKLNRSRKSTTLKRTLSESKDTTKRQKVSPKSRRESSPTRKSSLSGGAKIAKDLVGVWRGWDTVSMKNRDLLMEAVHQLESSVGLSEVLKEFDQPNVTANQLGGLTRLYFKDPKVFYECQKNNNTKEKSNDEYTDLVQHQLKELLKGYAHTKQEPPYSFAILIVIALMSSGKGKLVPEEIINFIKDQFPFYQHQRNWQLSIYVVLRWNKVFTRRCSSNCTAKNEEHEGCWKIDLITASQLLGRALDSRLNQETQVETNSAGVVPQVNDIVRETNARVVNHQRSGVLFLHQSEEQQQFKENLNLNNLTLKDPHQRVVSEKMNGTSVIVFSKKHSESPKAEVSDSSVVSSSLGDVAAASESLLLLAKSAESDQVNSCDVETCENLAHSSQEANTTCQFCLSTFNCSFMLESHMNNHLKEPCNPCFLCHKFLPSAYELWVHMKNYHVNKDNLHVSSALCHLSV